MHTYNIFKQQQQLQERQMPMPPPTQQPPNIFSNNGVGGRQGGQILGQSGLTSSAIQGGGMPPQ